MCAIVCILSDYMPFFSVGLISHCIDTETVSCTFLAASGEVNILSLS